jgi:hypothetical protein
MAATLSTSSNLGLGYQTGFFSGPVGAPLAQDFFDAAFAGRINTNKIYKESYHCNLVDECTMSTWLVEYMGYETDCYPAYTLLETYGQRNIVDVEIGVVVAAYPDTTLIHLRNNSHFVNGAYVLPQVGNTIVLTPRGELAKVTAVSTASVGDSTITVQLRNTTAAAQTVTAGDSLLVLSGSEIADCACPTGQFAVNDLPIEFDVSMITIGDLGELCGDALNKCQFLKIPFTDECGNVIEKWYTQALVDMYKRFEQRKHYERLLNPNWGIIPVIKARGMKWTPASVNEITTDDVRTWKGLLNLAGISCKEYAIFAGRTLYSQFQRMLLAAGVVKLDNTLQPNMGCKWINMEYCGIQVEGLTLHIYEDCSFSNGKTLGSGSSVFPASAIIVPMCNRPACTRSNSRGDGGGGDTKMLSTVYFRSLDGRVWDNLTDSNGILGTRNTFGTGCETQQWSVKTRLLQEVHCANQWGYIGLT